MRGRAQHFLIGFVLIGIKTSFVEAQSVESLFSVPNGNVVSGNKDYLDRFNYDVTVPRSDGFKDYGPEDWGDIQCDEENSLKSCLAYRDKWETGREWGISENYCRSCPKDDSETCDRHHQSPINLQREVGYEPDPNSTDYNELSNECIVSSIDRWICIQRPEIR